MIRRRTVRIHLLRDCLITIRTPIGYGTAEHINMNEISVTSQVRSQTMSAAEIAKSADRPMPRARNGRLDPQ